MLLFFFFKRKTAYDVRISDWSSDVCSSDLFHHFKALTLGKTVLMGSHTARSLGRALPGRRNLVLTRSGSAPYPGTQAMASLQSACAALADDDELMVIGGAQVYAVTLP